MCERLCWSTLLLLMHWNDALGRVPARTLFRPHICDGRGPLPQTAAAEYHASIRCCLNMRSPWNWPGQFGGFVPGLISAIELSFNSKELVLLRKRLALIPVNGGAVSVLRVWDRRIEITPSFL